MSSVHFSTSHSDNSEVRPALLRVLKPRMPCGQVGFVEQVIFCRSLPSAVDRGQAADSHSHERPAGRCPLPGPASSLSRRPRGSYLANRQRMTFAGREIPPHAARGMRDVEPVKAEQVCAAL